MSFFVKPLIIFALLMLLFGFGVCNHIYAIFDSSADSPALSCISGDTVAGDDGVQTFSFSDMELGFKSVSETYSFCSSQRMRRAVEFLDVFKGFVHELCLRESLLVLNRSKSCYSNKKLYRAHAGCEYYVFALRRILI